MSNFTVITDEDAALFNRLLTFYKEVCRLTWDHDTLDCGPDTSAVVYPDRLGQALERVDSEWWKTVDK